MDPKDKNIMREAPRDPKDTVFSNGGLKTTLLYGVFITVAVLIAYLSAFWMNGVFSYNEILHMNINNPIVHQAQTMSFTALAFAELFHMLGMSAGNSSVISVFKKKNKMLWLAFIAGIALQFFVILVPGVQDVFSTCSLGWDEWLITAGAALAPLIAHECITLFSYLKNKRINK